jgi:hypothetical protein
MDPKLIKAISVQVYSQFPEMNNVQPKVRKQQPSSPSSNSSKSAQALTFLLTYQTKVSVSEDKTISRWVRVTTNEHGKIIKLSTSH